MTKAKILSFFAVSVLLLAVFRPSPWPSYREDFSKTLPLKAGERLLPRERQRRRHRLHLERGQGRDQGRQDRPRATRRTCKDVEIRVEEIGRGRFRSRPSGRSSRAGPTSTSISRSRSPRASFSTKSRRSTAGSRSRGRYGRADVGTTNGSVKVEDGSGELKADTTNGGIRVSRFEGRFEAETTNGNIRLEGPERSRTASRPRRPTAPSPLAFVSPETPQRRSLRRRYDKRRYHRRFPGDP